MRQAAQPEEMEGAGPGVVQDVPGVQTIRVSCPTCGIHVASVPWAEPGSRFTRSSGDTVAWLCVQTCRKAVSEPMGAGWRSVGPICGRVFGRLERESGRGRPGGLRCIGVDGTSCRKGHKCLAVVAGRDRGRVVWCREGYGKKVPGGFLSQLTEAQRASAGVVSGDGARWIDASMAEWLPNARRVMDPFHVVSWMQDVLDGVRKEAWRRAKGTGAPMPKPRAGRPRKGEPRPERLASRIKGSRYALLKNPEDLIGRQRDALETIARGYKPPCRAYLLKERLRDVFRMGDPEIAQDRLDSWLASACHSGRQEIKDLSKKIRRRKDSIIEAVRLGVSNARVEAASNKIKLCVRMAYGFRNMDNLMALIMLRRSGMPVRLPGREGQQ